MTDTPVLRVGTRASRLARTQSGQVADALAAALGREVELVDVSTQGDTSSAPLASFGGVGVFVSALRDALLRGEVDVAVHSLKDLPTAPHDGITLAAVPQREDPRDVVVARDGLSLGELPPGSRIGTGSPRRAAQLHALGLGFVVEAIRGNVDTRIGKVTGGELDAVVLARAGIARLGRLDEVTEVLDPLQMLPAPGQGALAVECRASDTELAEAVRAALDDPPGWARWPRWPRATTARSCGSGPWPWPRTEESRSVAPRRGHRGMRARSGAGSRRRCWPTERARSSRRRCRDDPEEEHQGDDGCAAYRAP